MGGNSKEVREPHGTSPWKRFGWTVKIFCTAWRGRWAEEMEFGSGR